MWTNKLIVLEQIISWLCFISTFWLSRVMISLMILDRFINSSIVDRQSSWLCLTRLFLDYVLLQHFVIEGDALPYVTMKLWHWKSHWKSRVMMNNLRTKEMSNAEKFSVWFKIFSVWFQCPWTTKENISVRLSGIITVVSFVNIFQCDFRVFSASQKFSVWFSV